MEHFHFGGQQAEGGGALHTQLCHLNCRRVVAVVVAGFYGRYCAPIIKIKTMALRALDRSALHINTTATATAGRGGAGAGGKGFGIWVRVHVLFCLVWFCFGFVRLLSYADAVG